MNTLKDFHNYFLLITEDIHIDFQNILFLINHNFTCLTIKSDLCFAIDKKFRGNNISISFPQRDVQLIK
jgi:small-conductance mechanosensitive channel